MLDSVSVRIEQGEFFSLLGPSGCGKTTLLRIIAGLEKADSGKILFKGQDISGWPAQQRPFRMVFQRHALFPHLKVFDNVAFGLKLQKLSKEEIRERVMEALSLVRMDGFQDRYPATLSGGQSQRVALARALVCRPEVVLLDEPLAALDQKLRETMQTELRLLQKRLGITFIYVTHDQQEAFAMSDRVAVMAEGRFEQISDPYSLYAEPQSLFTAQFVGLASSLPVESCLETQTLKFCGQQLSGRSIGEPGTQSAVAVVRPEAFRLAADLGINDNLNSITGVVQETTFRGAWTELRVVTASGHEFSVHQAREKALTGPKEGESVEVYFSPEDTKIFWQAGSGAMQ
ncbi:MAG: hypothetical protein ABS42_00335 [Bdellovibrio sp. SCN 50-8]|nr:MAG: hypothetical protein ABS42_00335 [Bdellovibrio sp. SCN 50-8]